MPIATITNLSHDGRGIAQLDGKVVFIAGALPNEEVVFEIKRNHQKYAEGVVTAINIGSPSRVAPRCKHFGVCGGCSLQHINSELQLEIKTKTLLEQLAHFGGIEPQELCAPLTSELWNYRHKARLGVKHVPKKDKTLIGFREQKSGYIIDMQECPILAEKINTLLPDLSKLLQELSIKKDIPQIELAVTEDVAGLVVRHLQNFSACDLDMLKAFAKQHQINLYLQPQDLQSIHLIWPENGDELLNYSLADFGVKFFFHPCDFTQVNPSLNRKMVKRAIELLDPKTDDVILDLFCGLGNFSLPLAKSCKKVLGIEGNEEMVRRAAYNANYNKIENAHYFCADLTKGFPDEIYQENVNKVLLDPPRTGALEVLGSIKNLFPEKILYISCNSATFARDAGELAKMDYQLAKVGIMDMFPHTKHMEVIGLFTLE